MSHKGQSLIKNNNNTIDSWKPAHSKDFLQELGSIMDNPEVRKFFDSYLDNWGDTKAIFMFMHTYKLIEEHSKTAFGVALPSEEIVKILRYIVNSSELRRMMVENTLFKQKSVKSI